MILLINSHIWIYEYRSSQDLIPHYRLAIVRSQNEKIYNKKHKNEKKKSKKIQNQLDDAFYKIETMNEKMLEYIQRELSDFFRIIIHV
jgi:hypothetical protein